LIGFIGVESAYARTFYESNGLFDITMGLVDNQSTRFQSKRSSNGPVVLASHVMFSIDQRLPPRILYETWFQSTRPEPAQSTGDSLQLSTGFEATGFGHGFGWHFLGLRHFLTLTLKHSMRAFSFFLRSVRQRHLDRQHWLAGNAMSMPCSPQESHV
jgi:hypothetical protein